MGLMDDMLATDAPLWLDPDMTPGAQTVVVTLPTGATRTINVQAFYDPPADFGDGKRPAIIVAVLNSATTGIAQSEFAAGGRWKMAIAYPKGTTATDLPINRVTTDMEADAGMWFVAVG